MSGTGAERAKPFTIATQVSPGEVNVTRAVAMGVASSPQVHAAIELARGERYEVVEELGRGGMGEVHLCLDRRIGRQVARKRAKDGAERSRFLREASVQGQLEHPTIVPLHDLAEDDEGELYFTMKAIRGRTLKAILTSRADPDTNPAMRTPTRKLLQALANASLGVAFAHSRGVIHRDLKPDNLMLGEFGETYVLDWGVAKIRSGGPSDDDLLQIPLRGSATKVGAMIGTAGYMSPEQCTGDVEVDEQSDVYSLGAILFEVLAGEPLHEGPPLERIDSTLSGVDIEARAAHWPADTSDLARVCASATALDRATRMKSARQLAEAIERCLDGTRDAGAAGAASATTELVESTAPISDSRAAPTMPPAALLTQAPVAVRVPVQVLATPKAPSPAVLITLAIALTSIVLVHGVLAREAPVWLVIQALAVVFLVRAASAGRS